MKKWLVVTNVVWIVIVFSLVVFAQNQVVNVRENMLKADEIAQVAAEMEERALEQALMARQAQAEAELQLQEAERALEACRD